MKKHFSVYAFALRRKLPKFLIRFLLLAVIGLGCYRMFGVKSGQYVSYKAYDEQTGEWIPIEDSEIGEYTDVETSESAYDSFSGGYSKLILTCIIVAGYVIAMASCLSLPSKRSRTENLRGRLRISEGSVFRWELAANLTVFLLLWMFLILILFGAGQIYQSVNGGLQGAPYIVISLYRYSLFHAVVPFYDLGQWLLTGLFFVISASLCLGMLFRDRTVRIVWIVFFAIIVLINSFEHIRDFLKGEVPLKLIGAVIVFGITLLICWMLTGREKGTEGVRETDPAKQTKNSAAGSVHPFCRYRFLPPVRDIRREIILYAVALLAMVNYSLLFFIDYWSNPKTIIDLSYRDDIKSLNEMLASRFFGLTLLVIFCVWKIVTYYMQFYRASRSVCVMRRLKSRSEMHVRCLALPVLCVLIAIILCALLLTGYIALYRHSVPYELNQEALEFWRMLI